MMDAETLGSVVQLARLAPSVHNAQPVRWRLAEGAIELGCDLKIRLPHADPDNTGAGLAAGAAVEATLLALSRHGLAGEATDLWFAAEDGPDWPGHRRAARIAVRDGDARKLAGLLEKRFTWRGAFAAEVPDLFGWSRTDTILLTDAPRREWLADLNDRASLDILRDPGFRAELLDWMRLDRGHPRLRRDGLSRAALRMGWQRAMLTRWGLGPFWPVLDRLGRTGPLTSEAEATRSAPVIACFHRPRDESPVASGRAYLTLWLQATSLGFAGWPMAALTDRAGTRGAIEDRLAMDPDRRLVLVLRFGKPTGPPPPRARRPVEELIDEPA